MRLEDALVERQGLLPSHKSTRSIDSPSSAKKNKNIPTAVLSALLFLLGAIIGVYLEGHQSSTRNRIPENWGSYETGFATEQLLPPELINLQIRKFGGNPYFLPNATEVIQLDPRQPVYVGTPSPELDDNWEYLISARYFPISESEAQQLWGVPRYMDYIWRDKHGELIKVDGEITFYGGFDTFHALHCLNELRKALSPDGYYNRSTLHGPIHDEHCINHIRQLLQCSATTSIIPSLYRPTVGIQYSDAGQPHVCREFAALHNYTRERVGRIRKIMPWRDVYF